jgi:hypothetical protein
MMYVCTCYWTIEHFCPAPPTPHTVVKKQHHYSCGFLSHNINFKQHTCFNLSFTFFFEHFLQRTMGLMFRIVFFKILCLPSFFSTFCKELWASGVVWLHLSIAFLVFFQQFLQGIKDFRCRMVTWFYLISSFFEHFLQRIQGLNLAGVSLNIARSSSASRVHLGPRFSNLMVPLSSAQVLLPCPS